jgi:hypothetical protein
VITQTETAAIADYLDDDAIPLDEKGKPWTDIAEAAGVVLPQTFHFKPPGHCTIKPEAIQIACQDDEGIINVACEEEKELTLAQATARLDWIDKQLPC